jgi:hypothetical protein
MKIRAYPLWIALMLAIGATAVVGVKAYAAPEATSEVDEDEIPGEAYIRMKLEFVKFTLDGKEWENHEYVDGAKTLVIRGIGRDEEHTVVLSPRDGISEPSTLLLAKADFKRTILKAKGKTRFVAYRANYTVDFGKSGQPAEPEKKVEKAKGDETAPASDDDNRSKPKVKKKGK